MERILPNPHDGGEGEKKKKAFGGTGWENAPVHLSVHPGPRRETWDLHRVQFNSHLSPSVSLFLSPSLISPVGSSNRNIWKALQARALSVAVAVEVRKRRIRAHLQQRVKMWEDEEEEVEGEKKEEEERRKFRKWKECKYSITGSRGLNLPVGCRLFHVSISESPLRKQKPGFPISSRAGLPFPDPVHYDPVMPSVSQSGLLSLSQPVCLPVSHWSGVGALSSLCLCCPCSSALQWYRESERGGEVAPSLSVHVDTLTVSRCVCVRVCVSLRAQARTSAKENKGGKSHRQEGRTGNQMMMVMMKTRWCWWYHVCEWEE